ncbi:magnesium-dependent phosphatase-1 [Ochromonadaceae sp. CCMP2298]|nr:magnesium-dependent phosphatase-1 [Ochromonadaceae sp. CCMP2298]
MSTRTYSSVKRLKLVAFDLDGTIWSPDMYQLWGGGAPFSNSPSNGDLLDCSGRTVRLLGISAEVLHELKDDPDLSDVKVAWVSCTDEPSWAAECLQKFKTTGGQMIATSADSSQIFKANKQVHFAKLKSQYPSIDFSEMLFFDNEMGNVRNVAKLGVRCVYCPEGITEAAWEEGLDMFR